MRPTHEQYVRWFGVYYHHFRRFQFHPWRTTQGIDASRTLTEAEVRASLRDFGEYIYGWLAIDGRPLTDQDYLFLYQDLVKHVMGPTKKVW